MYKKLVYFYHSMKEGKKCLTKMKKNLGIGSHSIGQNLQNLLEYFFRAKRRKSK